MRKKSDGDQAPVLSNRGFVFRWEQLWTTASAPWSYTLLSNTLHTGVVMAITSLWKYTDIQSYSHVHSPGSSRLHAVKASCLPGNFFGLIWCYQMFHTQQHHLALLFSSSEEWNIGVCPQSVCNYLPSYEFSFEKNGKKMLTAMQMYIYFFFICPFVLIISVILIRTRVT